MKTVELKYYPGDKCWVKGQHRECIIEEVTLSKSDVTYTWYNLDVGYDITEVWDDGCFTKKDIGKTVFDTLEELEKAFPEDFDFGDEDE